jgi:small GTP-binding protein
MAAIPSYRLIIVGSGGVGKTSILKRLVEDSFTEDSIATIGVESESTVIMVENQKVKLRIWDTAGQERFRSVAKSYYRKAVGVIVVYDLTDRKSFDELTTWFTDIHALGDPNAVIQLVGNKSDLADGRVVTLSEAEEFAEHHRIQYLETSAKAGANVREAFVRIAALILQKGIKGTEQSVNQDPLLSGVGGLGAGTPPAKDGGCC